MQVNTETYVIKKLFVSLGLGDVIPKIQKYVNIGRMVDLIKNNNIRLYIQLDPKNGKDIDDTKNLSSSEVCRFRSVARNMLLYNLECDSYKNMMNDLFLIQATPSIHRITFMTRGAFYIAIFGGDVDGKKKYDYFSFGIPSRHLHLISL
jgi:hypothetical protein